MQNFYFYTFYFFYFFYFFGGWAWPSQPGPVTGPSQWPGSFTRRRAWTAHARLLQNMQLKCREGKRNLPVGALEDEDDNWPALLLSVTAFCLLLWFCSFSPGLVLFVHLCLRFQVSLLLFVPSCCVFLLVPRVFFCVRFFLYRLFVFSPSSISGVEDGEGSDPFSSVAFSGFYKARGRPLFLWEETGERKSATLVSLGSSPAQDEGDGNKGMTFCRLNVSSLWFFSFFSLLPVPPCLFSCSSPDLYLYVMLEFWD